MFNREKIERNVITVFNVPNCMSYARIILIPFFIYFFLTGNLIAAAMMLVLSGLSDMFDGYFARKLNQVTELGKLLDPIADKLTLGAVVICMWIRYASKEISVLSVCFAIMILKELLMAIGSFVLFSKGLKPGAAKWYGKISTVFFYFIMILLVVFELFSIDFAYKDTFVLALVILSVLLMIGAFCGYAVGAVKALRSISAKNNESNDKEKVNEAL